MVIKNINQVSTVALAATLFWAGSAQAVTTPEGPTGTGLDLLVDIINTDARLARKIPAEEIAAGAAAANGMNHILVEAVKETGVANDSVISTADARELNDYIFANHHADWVILHGDDENGTETGFHLVQGDGARTRLFNKNAVNKVADGIYHLGFETHRKNRLMNEDGDKNASFKQVGTWVNSLLAQDLAGSGIDLRNPLVTEVTDLELTGTGLDVIVDIIYTDPRLAKRISTGDMREGAAAAHGMNQIILDSMAMLGVTADDTITPQEVIDLALHIQTNAQAQWIVFHGDDEENEETGYHLVQGDGAKTKLFNKNAVNKVFDGIYHLGFGVNNATKINKIRLVNEDGNDNVKVKKVANWLNQLLEDDMKNDRI